jgi:hypothetical protein
MKISNKKLKLLHIQKQIAYPIQNLSQESKIKLKQLQDKLERK